MALEKQLMDLPLATGLQQKTDSRTLQVGAQTSIVNGQWTKTGALRKRPGYAALSAGPTAARALMDVGGQLAAIDGQNVWNLTSANGWQSADKVSEAVATRTGVAVAPQNFISYDSYTNGTYTITCWVDSVNSVYVHVTDANGVTTMRQRRVGTSTANNAKCIIVGTTGIIVWCANGGLMKAIPINLTTMIIPSGETTISVSVCNQSIFDIAPVIGGTTWTLAFAGGTYISVENFYATLVSVSGGAITIPAAFGMGGTSANVFGIGIRATISETLWVAYVATSGLNAYWRFAALDPSTLSLSSDTSMGNEVFGATNYRIAVERTSASQAVIVWQAVNGTAVMRWQLISTSGSLVNVQGQLRGWGLASKPFLYAGTGRTYALLAWTGNGTGTTVYPSSASLTELTAQAASARVNARPVATIAPRIVRYIAYGSSSLCAVSAASSTQFTTAAPIIRSQSKVGVDLVTFDFGSASYQSVQLGQHTYIAGGVPSCYDGWQNTEIGFLAPSPAAATPAAVGGLMAATTYAYLVVYEFTLPSGERKQSRPCPVTNVIVGGAGTGQVTLTIDYLAMLLEQQTPNLTPQVGVAIYRTAPSVGLSGVYFRIAAETLPTGLLNDPLNASATLTYVDTLADASITSNATIYTTGATGQPVMSQNPSSMTGLIAHANRLVGIGDDGISLWVSTAYDGGTTQPRFADEFVYQVPRGGKITALASMDGQLIIFKRNSIFVMRGSGPNETNTQSDLSDAIEIPTDVGCSQDWRSVVLTPKGIVFVYSGKVYRLDRGLSVEYISHPVEDLLAANPYCTSAVLMPGNDEVRMTFRPTASSANGITVVYNYMLDRWTQWLLTLPASGGGGTAVSSSSAAHAARSNGDTYYWAADTGQVMAENQSLSAAGAYLDGSTWITISVSSAWAKATGLQGWQRFYHAAAAVELLSPCCLTMAVGTDYNPTSTQTNTFTDAQIATWTTPLAQFSTHIAQQKTQSVRVTLSDAAPLTLGTLTGAGPNFLGVTLEYGIYSGGARLPPSQGA